MIRVEGQRDAEAAIKKKIRELMGGA